MSCPVQTWRALRSLRSTFFVITERENEEQLAQIPRPEGQAKHELQLESGSPTTKLAAFHAVLNLHRTSNIEEDAKGNLSSSFKD